MSTPGPTRSRTSRALRPRPLLLVCALALSGATALGCDLGIKFTPDWDASPPPRYPVTDAYPDTPIDAPPDFQVNPPPDTATDRGPLSPCPFEAPWGVMPSGFPIGCPDGQYNWYDRSGGPPRPDGGPTGGPVYGDNRCYKRCTSDSDCTDPDHPYCSVLGLFAGADNSCNQVVRICRCKRNNDCGSRTESTRTP
jgi:hypothetical protein